jgi:hypothetical protein
MKRIAIAGLLFLTAVAATKPQEEYSVKVHVFSSRVFTDPRMDETPEISQMLGVMIDGRKYDLEGPPIKKPDRKSITLLALGDYRAKLVVDEHDTAYEFARAYEVLLPDNKKVRLFVVAQSE